jgi:hypothetical protein
MDSMMGVMPRSGFEAALQLRTASAIEMNHVVWLVSQPSRGPPGKLDKQFLKFPSACECVDQNQTKATDSKNSFQHFAPFGSHLATDSGDINENEPSAMRVKYYHIWKLAPRRRP